MTRNTGLLVLASLLAVPLWARAGEPADAGPVSLTDDGPDAGAPAAAALAVHAPPPLPADASPASLYAALPAADRATLDKDMKVVTFDERIVDQRDRTELVGVSIGVSAQSPEALRSVLAAVNDYPSWLLLHPSYKAARVEGRSRLVAEIGSADAPKAKRTMVYDVEPTALGATWTVVDSGTALQAGSSLGIEVAPHPTMAGASLVVHRQVGFLSGGRMLKYLASDDKNGKNRWWKDSNRHARRLQGALEAAASEPPGAERRRAYIARFQREFGGRVPYWAE